MQLMQVFISR